MHENKENSIGVAYFEKVDRDILAVLYRNPRASWDVVGSILDLSPSTVSRRMRKLLEAQYIQFVGEVPWKFYSTTYPAYCHISTQGGQVQDFVEWLCSLPETQHVASLLGKYDVYVAVHAQSFERTVAVIDEIQRSGSVAEMAVAPVLQCGLKASAWRPQDLTPEQEGKVQAAFANTPAPTVRFDDFEYVDALPDPTERRVISLLQANSRVTATEVAQSIGKSSPVAQRLIDKSIEKGWFRPRIEVPLEALGYGTKFFINVDTLPQHTEHVLAQLAEHPASRLVTQVAGVSDIQATGVASSRRHLADIINREFSQIEGIVKTRTDIISRDWKRFWSRRGATGDIGDFTPPQIL